MDFVWGVWHGFIAWIALLAHVFSTWEGHPVYEVVRKGNWYDFGFLLGAGSPLLEILGNRRNRKRSDRSET